jgi:hypothetical protein
VGSGAGESVAGMVSIRNNVIIDTRGTPYGNSPWRTSGIPAQYLDIKGNFTTGYRVAPTTWDNTSQETKSGVNIHTANMKYTAGATAGAGGDRKSVV